MKTIELLAPSGNLDSLIGAINAGANAVYLAGKRFGARAFSNNFDDENLIDAIHYAHLRGVFVYVTINTLIFDDELDELIKFTDMLVKHHVDALIIQDFGMIDLLSKRYPKIDIHASTQMNVHNINQAKILKELGVKRIVMARETPLTTIRQIKKTMDIEVEVFVHGALCVSYSGNCLMSSMQGGRSGNRGQCAQPCRLPYRLFKDDQSISDQSYLLSTKDLMTIEYIDQLIESGVDSLKIEGRMRKAEYVVQSVLSYRKAINSYHKKQKMSFQEEVNRLKRVFNREYTKGYIMSEEPNQINNNFRPNHLGVPIGTVINYQNNRATIQLSDSLEVKDGFRIIGESDFGDQVSRIISRNKIVKHADAQEIIQLDVPEFVSKGSLVVKTLDYELEKSLSLFLNDTYKAVGLSCEVYAFINQPIKLIISDDTHQVTLHSEGIIERAMHTPVIENKIIEQISKLGQTPFYFNPLKVKTDNECFIPLRLLNELRRQAIEEISLLRIKREEPVIIKDTDLGQSSFKQNSFQLIANVTNEEQLSAVKEKKIKTIYYNDNLIIKNDFNFDLIPVLKRIEFHPKLITNKTSVIDEIGSLFGHKNEMISNTFLNVTNIYTAHLLSKYHVSRITLSPELSRERLIAFADNYKKRFLQYPNLELVVYGRIDLMISKYCPIAKTYKTRVNCHLCEMNQYYLQNRLGSKFPLVNDGNCNIRVLNSKPLNLIEYIDELRLANINTIRLDFTTEKYHDVTHLIKTYQQVLNGGKMLLNSEEFTKGRYLR